MHHQIKRVRYNKLETIKPDQLFVCKPCNIGQPLVAVKNKPFVMDDDAKGGIMAPWSVLRSWLLHLASSSGGGSGAIEEPKGAHDQKCGCHCHEDLLFVFAPQGRRTIDKYRVGRQHTWVGTPSFKLLPVKHRYMRIFQRSYPLVKFEVPLNSSMPFIANAVASDSTRMTLPPMVPIPPTTVS